ncbi:MAG: [FeFe] hydrogenase H-cluster radical SAM maturase HydE, partial [Ruminococcus sp.]|nr:[FeFe] hydrogenase H-cluster radical SAM maturase HydE [Ruminococcus sp.]
MNLKPTQLNPAPLKKIYYRGLIEFSNFCKNNCYYCGIRRDNRNVIRYRLTKEEILECCKKGYRLGVRTFVLQSGEDTFFTDKIMCDIVSSIKEEYPDCAVTLSIGERSFESYKTLKNAGADRYLLRHETSNEEHYKKLHPSEMSFKNRINCLHNLKEIGFTVGCGFMVESPHQTAEDIENEFEFLKQFKPHMVGIGPFLPHKDTPFCDFKAGTLETTLYCIKRTREVLPSALIPATTALGSIAADGREQGILQGANVVMPNISPQNTRDKYLLYDGKICTEEDADECIPCLKRRLM